MISQKLKLDKSWISNYIRIMKTDHIISLVADLRESAFRFLIAELKKHDMGDLVPTHGTILNALYNKEPRSMKELADIANRDKSTVTTLVDKLVNLGYIKKEKSADDTRVTLLYLTAKGKKVKPAFDQISDDLIKRAYKGIKKSEKEEFVRTILKMIDNF